MPGQHKKFGGSTAPNWLNCPGWAALAAQCPEKSSSVYAEDGTRAHDWGKFLLKNGERDARLYVGALLDPKLGFEMLRVETADAINVYLNAVWAEFDRYPGAEMHVEEEVTMKAPGLGDDAGGTPDCWIWHPKKRRLVTFDYKHGVGVTVHVAGNSQLQFYSTCIIDTHGEIDPLDCENVVVQPRAREMDSPDGITREPFQQAERTDFRDRALKAIDKAQAIAEGKEEPTYKTGSWCRWCQAAPYCPAKQGEAMQAFEGIKIEETPPAALTDVQLAGIVGKLQELIAYGNQCQEILEGRVLEGHPVPGWKVVEKLGKRKWVDDGHEIAQGLEALYGIPEDESHPRKMRPFTEIEPLMKSYGATKDQIEKFREINTRKDSGGLTVARESDPRPAVNAAERAFGDVDTSGFGNGPEK